MRCAYQYPRDSLRPMPGLPRTPPTNAPGVTTARRDRGSRPRGPARKEHTETLPGAGSRLTAVRAQRAATVQKTRRPRSCARWDTTALRARSSPSLAREGPSVTAPACGKLRTAAPAGAAGIAPRRAWQSRTGSAIEATTAARAPSPRPLLTASRAGSARVAATAPLAPSLRPTAQPAATTRAKAKPSRPTASYALRDPTARAQASPPPLAPARQATTALPALYSRRKRRLTQATTRPRARLRRPSASRGPTTPTPPRPRARLVSQAGCAPPPDCGPKLIAAQVTGALRARPPLARAQ